MPVYISVDKRSRDGAIQVSINADGHGFRIAGPKYDGSGTNLLTKEITATDAAEIKRYLKQASQ